MMHKCGGSRKRSPVPSSLWIGSMATVSRTRRSSSSPSATPPAAWVYSDRLSLHIPATAHTLAGFRAWVLSDDFPEHIRVAFIDQEIHLDMSQEELETHNKVKMEVSRVLLNLNREEKRGQFYGDGVLVTNEGAVVSNNPDGIFVLTRSLRSGRVRFVPRTGKAGQYIEIEGIPDWVMEVVSDSSVGKDTQRLRAAYQRAGIREYWLIDARGEDIVFQILYWRKNGYVAAPVQDGWQRSPVFGRRFRLERQRDPLGLWEYTLHVRPA